MTMKRKDLLVAVVAAAGITTAGAASAAVQANDAVSYERAAAEGSVSAFQNFLSDHPDSPRAGEALGNMIQVAAAGKAQGFARSGNPKAAGGPDNPGVGNPHTPAC